MTGAMYAGISGMKSHMSKLNVIGNNVANVNTAGYKAGITLFAESIYTTTKAGSNGTGSVGGTNPMQIGYGCSIGTIGLDMSTKNYVPTGKPSDVMISGDGFYMLGDKNGNLNTDPASLLLSRVGNFEFDSEGYLTDGAGNVVYGFLSAGANAASTTNDYNPGGATVAGQSEGVSTQLVPIRLPMAANNTVAAPAEEGDALYPYPDPATGMTDNTSAISSGKRIKLNSMSIGENGEIIGVNGQTGDPVVVGYIPLASVANPGGVTHVGGPYYQALGGAGRVQVASVGGIIEGNLNNVAAATAGADPILGKTGNELIPGGLESSGTDVATEFSEMITTQRGYQANTRIITVTDSMLEELVNLKR